MLGRGLVTREVGKVCSRTALLDCPERDVLGNKGGRMVSTSGCTGKTHQSLSPSLCHPMHTLVFGK